MSDEGKTTGTLEVTVEDLKAFAGAWDRHEVDTIMTFFTDDCVFIAGWGERFVGKERVREGVSEFFTKFPDGRFSDGHHFISGNRGVSEWTFTATGSDGVKLEMTGCDLFAFENGKIAVKNAFRKDRIS